MCTYFARLSHSDTFLAHFLSFSATPTYHTLPQKMQDGMPLFHLPPNQAKPVCKPDKRVCEHVYIYVPN